VSGRQTNPAPASRLASLRRITSGGRFIPEIDGFRLLAILVVLNEHIYLQVALPKGLPWPRILTLPDGGMRGVYLFFTISGFILSLPFARRALVNTPSAPAFSYSAYLKRRVTRLEPPYVLTLLLRFILLLTVMRAAGDALGPHFAATLFYVHSLVYGSMSTISPPTWSLEVEVQFYLLAPFLAGVFRIRSPFHRRALLVIVTLGFALFANSLSINSPRLALSLAGNLQYFTAGLLLCDLYLTCPLRKLSEYAWDFLGIGALALLLWATSRWAIVVFPFGTVVLYLAGLRGRYVRRLFAAPLVSIAGGMCYSVYLTHGTVLAAVAKAFSHFDLSALPMFVQLSMVLALSLIAAFLVGAICFVVLERPCMDPRWPEKLVAAVRRRFRV
jgi:peptidoglycan/LPS O-acetylase OafA/YrhL